MDGQKSYGEGVQAPAGNGEQQAKSPAPTQGSH